MMILGYRLNMGKSHTWKSSLSMMKMRLSTKTGGYNFGSSKYAASFQSLPECNPLKLRQSALQYLESYSSQQWYQDPVSHSILYL